MVTKPPSKKATKKRASKTPPKKAAKKSATNASVKKKPARKAAAKKRPSTAAAATAGRPTQPAKPKPKRIERDAGDGGSRPAPGSAPPSMPAASPAGIPPAPPVPVTSRPPEPRHRAEPHKQPASGPPSGGSRPPKRSYLEGVPRDHADLVAGLIQVVRGAAKDLRTLVTQAISMSHQKDHRSDR